MTTRQAIAQRWGGTPVTLEAAADALKDYPACIACGSHLLVAIKRPPVDAFRAHCNHCGSEIPIAVMINREAWQVTAIL